MKSPTMKTKQYPLKLLSVLALASLTVLCQTGYSAQKLKKSPKLTAGQIVATHLKTMGGVEAHKKFKTRRMEMRACPASSRTPA